MWNITRLLAALFLVLSIFVLPAYSQGFNTGGGGGAGGGIKSLASGCGTAASPNPVVNTGSINANIPLTASSPITTTPYAITAADACNLLLLQSGASVLTLPNTATTGFGANKFWYFDNESGADVTVNVTSPSNLNGSATVTLTAGTAGGFQSDGTNYHFFAKSAPGIGTVVSVTGSCGIATTSPTSAAVVTGGVVPTIITASNAPITAAYCGGIEYLSNASNQVPTINQAGSAGFPVNWYTTVCNIAAGTQTITTVGGTIGGLASFLLQSGSPSAPVCVGLISDGISDYKVTNGTAGTVTLVSAGCGNTTGTGGITSAGTIFGVNTPTLLTGANQPITAGYCGGTEYLQNGSNQIPTIAGAGTTGFPVGWFTGLCNSGAGTQTITPGAGTIGGAATKVLAAGSATAPVCITIISDGTSNYFIR